MSLEGVEEYDHAGLPGFRVGGRKFASLASQPEGYGNLRTLILSIGEETVLVPAAAASHAFPRTSSGDVPRDSR